MNKPDTATTMDNTNEHRPGYQWTKLGWVPEGWEIVEIGEITDVKVGRDLKEDSFSKTSDNKYKYPVYSNTIENFGLYGFYDFPEYNGNSLTVVGRGVGLGTAFAREQSFGAIGRLLVLFPKGRNDARYLTYFINSRVRFFVESSGIPQLTGIQISKYKVALPPLPEQKNIAAILSTWDAAIQALQELIAAKEQQQKGLMQRLLSPEDSWEVYKYGQLVKEVKRLIKFDDSELYDLISVRRRSGGLFHRESLYGHQIKTKNLREAREGDFLISKMQIVHGASGLTTSEFDGMKISGSYIAGVSKNPKILDIEYFNWLSKMPWFYHQTYFSSYGVHIEKMTFDFKTFLKQEVRVPSIEEQRKCVRILNLTEQEIETLKQKLDTLKAQKKGLMQRLLTGEVRTV